MPSESNPFLAYIFDPEISGKEVRTSGAAVSVSHMHIFGDKHTHTHYDQEVSLAHGMHECYKLSHTSCTTVLSRRTKALSDYSQRLSASEALFTLTTLQSERGS